MDDHYDPTHKASSVSSTTSTSTNGTVPSLYSATSSIGGDVEEFGPLEVFDPSSSLSMPADDDYYPLYKQQQAVCADSNAMIDAFLDIDSLISLSPPSRKRRSSDAGNSVATTTSETDDPRQDKRARELLTDDERRANHIASEQKRRNTIRTGFKDLTDLIPTLKNINHSKSTILFKAVDYVRHLEKRNRSLRDKLASLQLRLEVEGRLGRRQSLLRFRNTTDIAHHPSGLSHPPSSGLAQETLAALVAHKKQQRQLELLQEQLRLQQELLAKHNIAYPSASSHISIPFSSPYLSSRHNALDAPSLNIPADDDHYVSELGRHESLGNRHYRPSS